MSKLTLGRVAEMRRLLVGMEAEGQVYSMVGDYPEEPDYYVLLGLSRNPPPTEAEIRSAS
jgi:hypothetical protein